VTAFGGVTVLLPVMNETASLRETVVRARTACGDDIREILLLVSARTSAESLRVCEELVRRDSSRTRVHVQKLPFLGGALREGFGLASSSHVVLMASDLETEPEAVARMIELARREPGALITASRWARGGGFRGYHPVKLIANYVFQRFFSLLYGVSLSDMTYGFRLFPAHLMKSIRWEELRHPFLFETLVKPLRLGIPVREIATSWRARTEGESQNPFFRNFAYFGVGLRTRFMSRKRILL